MKVLIEYAKSPGGTSTGAFLVCFVEGSLNPRLATDYSPLSSHLQM